MAKTSSVRNAPTVAESTPDLSAKVTKAVDLIKRPFIQFVKDFQALAQSREELAPKFMKAFGMWQAETAGTFVDFVRLLAPDVGKTRNEYRNHRAYQSADYLRRLVGNARRQPLTQAERAAAPASPTDSLARVMASLLTIIPEDQHERVWKAMTDSLHYTDRQVTRLQTQVEHVDPLVRIQGQVQRLRLSFPTATEEQHEAAA